nr:MAG TPA: hypothetical protein [Caudoviricetes sp.]
MPISLLGGLIANLNYIDSHLCLCYYNIDAAVAQVVAHLIGSEEVTGPSPVSSLTKTLDFTRVIFLCVIFRVIYFQCVIQPCL